MTSTPTARRIEMWPVTRLVPYERNARTHSPEQVAQIAASIREFGFTNPILVDSSDGIIAGHGRLAAAKDIGMTMVPVIVLDHLTAEQRRAYVIADNQLALNAEWDMSLLQQEVMSLNLVDFDLDLLGFDDEFLQGLIDPDGINSHDNELGEADENIYTDKTEVPPYTKIGPKPDIKDLCITAKTEELIDAIKSSNASDDEKNMLIAAAYRHSVFNYQRIAEYYAHSDPHIQELFEQSALVIVDIGYAIKNGWARLQDKLDEIYTDEKGDDNHDA